MAYCVYDTRIHVCSRIAHAFIELLSILYGQFMEGGLVFVLLSSKEQPFLMKVDLWIGCLNLGHTKVYLVS